jgi:hypothetical protein
MSDIGFIMALGAGRTARKALKKIDPKKYFKVSTPALFKWTNHTLDGRIFVGTDGNYYTDFDVTDYAGIAPGQTYYAAKHGNDNFDGLTWDTAFKTPFKALGMPDRGVIVVGPGIYNRTEGTQGTVITRDVAMIGIGDVRFGQFDALTWTLNAGMTNTYKATRSNVMSVWDGKTLDSFGDYAQLTLKASAAEVEATAGSYFADATTVYVRTADNRAPDANIFVYIGVAGFSGKGKFYMENIQFEGGSLPLKIDSTYDGVNPATVSKFYAKNVSVKYAGSGNGWNILGTDSILQDCVAARSLDDGFNYHLSNGVNCNAIEINCIGRHNGVTSDTDNGTTMHDGGTIIRVGGKYFGNKGCNVADVTSGTHSWNVGVQAYNSTGGGVFHTDFEMSDGSGGAVRAWLEGCTTPNSTSTYNLSVLDAASTVKTRGSVLNARNGTAAGTY